MEGTPHARGIQAGGLAYREGRARSEERNQTKRHEQGTEAPTSPTRNTRHKPGPGRRPTQRRGSLPHPTDKAKGKHHRRETSDHELRKRLKFSHEHPHTARACSDAQSRSKSSDQARSTRSRRPRARTRQQAMCARQAPAGAGFATRTGTGVSSVTTGTISPLSSPHSGTLSANTAR
jgi:hypothetical protein